MEEATFLTKFASEVVVVHRRGELRASKAMQQKAFANKKILFEWNADIQEVLGREVGRVTGVHIRNNQTNEEKNIACDGYFAAIGHRPNTDLFKDQLEIDVKGYLVHEHDSSKTAIPGVFVAGDAADHHYRQAVTAAGMGCMAAMDVERYLASRE